MLYLNALVLTILDLFGVLVWLWCEFQKYLITFKKNVNDRNDFHIIKSLLLPLSKFEAISKAAACCFYPVSDMTYPIKTHDLSLMKLNFQIFKSNPEVKIEFYISVVTWRHLGGREIDLLTQFDDSLILLKTRADLVYNFYLSRL